MKVEKINEKDECIKLIERMKKDKQIEKIQCEIHNIAIKIKEEQDKLGKSNIDLEELKKIIKVKSFDSQLNKFIDSKKGGTEQEKQKYKDFENVVKAFINKYLNNFKDKESQTGGEGSGEVEETTEQLIERFKAYIDGNDIKLEKLYDDLNFADNQEKEIQILNIMDAFRVKLKIYLRLNNRNVAKKIPYWKDDSKKATYLESQNLKIQGNTNPNKYNLRQLITDSTEKIVGGNNYYKVFTSDEDDNLIGELSKNDPKEICVELERLKDNEDKNLCCFAYGPSGSGKTYFLLSGDNPLIQRIYDYYGEQQKLQLKEIFDLGIDYDGLLNQGIDYFNRNNIKVKKNILFQGNATTYDDFKNVYTKVQEKRMCNGIEATIKSMPLNNESSRSHLFIILKLKNGGSIIVIDMAGSESFGSYANKFLNQRDYYLKPQPEFTGSEKSYKTEFKYLRRFNNFENLINRNILINPNLPSNFFEEFKLEPTQKKIKNKVSGKLEWKKASQIPESKEIIFRESGVETELKAKLEYVNVDNLFKNLDNQELSNLFNYEPIKNETYYNDFKEKLRYKTNTLTYYKPCIMSQSIRSFTKDSQLKLKVIEPLIKSVQEIQKIFTFLNEQNHPVYLAKLVNTMKKGKISLLPSLYIRYLESVYINTSLGIFQRLMMNIMEKNDSNFNKLSLPETNDDEYRDKFMKLMKYILFVDPTLVDFRILQDEIIESKNSSIRQWIDGEIDNIIESTPISLSDNEYNFSYLFDKILNTNESGNYVDSKEINISFDNLEKTGGNLFGSLSSTSKAYIKLLSIYKQIASYITHKVCSYDINMKDLNNLAFNKEKFMCNTKNINEELKKNTLEKKDNLLKNKQYFNDSVEGIDKVITSFLNEFSGGDNSLQKYFNDKTSFLMFCTIHADADEARNTTSSLLYANIISNTLNKVIKEQEELNINIDDDLLRIFKEKCKILGDLKIGNFEDLKSIKEFIDQLNEEDKDIILDLLKNDEHLNKDIFGDNFKEFFEKFERVFEYKGKTINNLKIELENLKNELQILNNELQN